MMALTHRVGLMSGVALISTGAFPCSALFAQSVDEIIVTARKIDERLQDAPVAVDVFTQEAITDFGLKDVDDLAKQTPGLSFEKSFGRRDDRPSIRGSAAVSTPDFGTESGVAFFVDGVYVSGAVSAFGLTDLERVEIIKGPQSALYGRNTYAGAINYVTAKPTNDFRGQVNATVATLGEKEINGMLRGPLIRDRLFFSIGGRYYDFNNNFRNQFDGSRIGDEQTKSVNAALTLDLGAFEATARVSYAEDRDGPFPLYVQGAQFNNCFPVDRTNTAIPIEFRRRANPNGFLTFCGTVKPPQGSLAFDARRPGDTQSNFIGLERDRLQTIVSLSYDFGPVTLSSLTGYGDEKRHDGFDGDGTAVPTINTNQQRYEEQDFSQELSIGSTASTPFRWLAGLYYYKFDGALDDGFTGRRREDNEIVNKAIFGLLGIDLTDRVHVSAEGRYAKETKTTVVGAGSGNIPLPTFRPPELAGTTYRFETESFNPRFTIDYKPSDDVLLYGIVARGNKPGGIQRGTGADARRYIPEDLSTFAEETQWSYEIGAKTTLLDRRLRFSISGYYNDVTNIQLTDNVPQRTTSFTRNFPKASVRGFELTADATPTEGLAIRITYAYIDARIDEGIDAEQDRLTPLIANDGSIAGQRIPRVPEHAVSVRAGYEAPLAGDFKWFVRSDLSLESNRFAQVDNLNGAGSAVVLNGRVGVESGNFSVTAFGKNLTKEDAVLSVLRFRDFLLFTPANGFQTPRGFLAALRNDRQFGVTVAYRY